MKLTLWHMIFKQWKLNLLFYINLSTFLNIQCSQNPATDLYACFSNWLSIISFLLFLPASATCYCWKQSQAPSYSFLWSLWDYLFSQLLLEVMHTMPFNVSNAWPMGNAHGTNLVPSLCYLNNDLLSKISFHSDSIFVLVAYQYPLQRKTHKASWVEQLRIYDRQSPVVFP